MKIEVGKQYRTRTGSRAVVLGINPFISDSSQYSVIGAIDGKLSPSCWKADGSFLPPAESGHDLVAEWVEPPTALELAQAFRAYYKPSMYKVEHYAGNCPPFAHILRLADAAIAAAEQK